MYTMDSLIGNEFLKEYLKKIKAANKLSHAYIITGEKGSGKSLFANIFAKFILCKDKEKICNKCPSCRQVNSENHPDIVYVSQGSKTGYGVKDIREQLVGDVFIRPYASQYKIYIVDQADTMTRQAQNAFLKTLEDPPPYAIFLLLVTNTNKLLDTVLSRVNQLRMAKISQEDIYSYLIARQVDQETARASSEYARGNIGLALDLASSEEFATRREKIFEIFRAYLEEKKDLRVFREELEKYEDLEKVLKLLRSLIRDCLILMETKDKDLVIHKRFYFEYIKLIDKGDRAKKMYDNVNNAIEMTNYHIKKKLIIWTCFI